MSVEENKAIVLRNFDEIHNAKKLERLDEILAPEFSGGRRPGQTEGGRDREATRKLWPLLWDAFPDWHATILDIVAAEDKVVVANRISGTHKGTYGGLPATGKQIEIDQIEVFRVAGGRIVERSGVTDSLAFVSQLGLVPSFQELVRSEDAPPEWKEIR